MCLDFHLATHWFACVLQEGKLSTGNSLDMTLQDEEFIKANDATVKDMEVSTHKLNHEHIWLLLSFRIVR